VCFGRVHATRRLKLPKCPCRGCGSDLTGHSVRCYDEDRRGNIGEAILDEQTNYYSIIHTRDDFVEFETDYDEEEEEEEDRGYNDGEDDIISDEFVSIVVASAEEGERIFQFSRRNCFTTQAGATPALSEKGAQFVADLFSLLHGIIMREEKEHGSDAVASRKLSLDVHPDQLFDFASKDDRLLMRCIFALATGKRLQIANTTKDVYNNSFRYGVFVACDMIRRIVLNKPCITQQVLGDQLSVYIAQIV
jgi:hypothetical protein